MTPTSSDFSDLFSQIGGLVAITCGAGIIWIILMTVVAQRASERRRRIRQGLPPLPGVHTQLLNLIRGQRASQPAPAISERVATPAATPPRRATAMPAPDLDLLTSDLPQPDLAAMFTDDIPEDPMPAYSEPLPEDFPIPPAETSAAPDSSAASAPLDSVELLRVWRDLSDGRLIVEIGGRRFTSLSDLRSADLERRFLSVMRELSAIAQPPTVQQAPPPRKDKPAPEVPSMRPGAMFRQMGRAAMGQGPEPVEEKPELSIADQIEELLQERLAEIPAFRARSIHVKPSLHGGVRIEVDGNFYEGIGEVAETDVRDLLQGVVREWESRQ